MQQKKSILIIEDDRFIGEMYTRSLRRADYDVTWVVDGHDGLVAAKNREYDIILLDIMLPEMNGVAILKNLRANGEDSIPNTKVVVLTNFEQDDDSREDMQTYADAYLIKAEITPRKLLEVLEKLPQ